MSRSILRNLGAVVLGVSGMLGMAAGAHAGLVSGAWDPPFGSFLPGLNWAIQANFQVSNACSAQADGNYSTASGACAGASTTNLYLRLYNASADPNNFFESDANSEYQDLQAIAAPYNGGYEISQVRVMDGQIIGFLAGFQGADSSPVFAEYLSPGEANNHAYGASLGVDGPTVVCYQCGPNNSDVTSSLDGLTQFLVTYTSVDNTDPKFTDANGNALGAVLDQYGNYLGQGRSPNNLVPEPGALALSLAALGALGAARRRKRCQPARAAVSLRPER